MKICFFIPALRQLSGGLDNIYATAAALADAGHKVALSGPSPDAAGFCEAALPQGGAGTGGKAGLSVLPWGTPPDKGDIWCIPESWPNAMTVGLKAGARVLVYVQNWVFMLGTLPDGVQWRSLPLEYVSVSRPVSWFLQNTLCLGKAVHDTILPPALPECFFQGNAQQAAPLGGPGKPAAKPVRVAYMPRKNKALAEQMRQVAEACLANEPNAPKVDWVGIHQMPRPEVAACLAGSDIFLSTGFPEGFGLPPLEAMAAGCVPVGFTGFGGWEYMRQARLGAYASAYQPPFDLSADIPGNGLYFSDGDTLAGGMGLAKAIIAAAQGGPEWQALVRACRETAARYTATARQKALATLFPL
ncbi:glycosyltransferase [Desulfovibrio sp. OttesenSCG-928-G15]|nr:glycosyltransferase [Desulfovibrio sp. OttesenSCG-928-G15]